MMPTLTDIFGMAGSWVRCTTCGLPFQVPEYLIDWASTDNINRFLHCPHGHPNKVGWGKNTPTRLEKRLASREAELKTMAAQWIAAKGQVTRLKRKVAKLLARSKGGSK